MLEGQYIVEGKPIPLARPRLSRHTTYNPQSHLLKEFNLVIDSQNPNKSMFIGPIEMNVVFYMPIPKSWSKKKQDEVYATFHKKRPDISNLIKFVEDGVQGVLYDDDCIISSVTAQKIYSFKPRTELTIREL